MDFHLLRNDHDCWERLMILVIAGKMPGKMLFNNVVSIGSSSHDLDLVPTINFFLPDPDPAH